MARAAGRIDGSAVPLVPCSVVVISCVSLGVDRGERFNLTFTAHDWRSAPQGWGPVVWQTSRESDSHRNIGFFYLWGCFPRLFTVQPRLDALGTHPHFTPSAGEAHREP